MTRVPNLNFQSAGTEFFIADSDTDSFDREDVSKLAKGVDDHDHSANRGKAVTRVANLAITTAMLANDAVDSTKLKDDAAVDANRAVMTNHIRDGAVTAAKLAAGAASGAALSADVATLTGTQTFSGTKSFAAIASLIMTGALKFHFGADIASTASATLPTSGNAFKVTGTGTIQSLTARDAGHVIMLVFLGNAFMRSGGNITLINGPLNAKPGTTITLISDSVSTWLELSRSGDKPMGCQLRMSADQVQNFTAADAIDWASAPVNNGPCWVSGNPSRYAPGVAGRHRVSGTIFETGGDIWSISLYISGVNQLLLAKDRDEGFSQKGLSFALEFVLNAAADYAEIFAFTDNHNSSRVESESHAAFSLVEAF